MFTKCGWKLKETTLGPQSEKGDCPIIWHLRVGRSANSELPIPPAANYGHSTILLPCPLTIQDARFTSKYILQQFFNKGGFYRTLSSVKSSSQFVVNLIYPEFSSPINVNWPGPGKRIRESLFSAFYFSIIYQLSSNSSRFNVSGCFIESVRWSPRGQPAGWCRALLGAGNRKWGKARKLERPEEMQILVQICFKFLFCQYVLHALKRLTLWYK